MPTDDDTPTNLLLSAALNMAVKATHVAHTEGLKLVGLDEEFPVEGITWRLRVYWEDGKVTLDGRPQSTGGPGEMLQALEALGFTMPGQAEDLSFSYVLPADWCLTVANKDAIHGGPDA